MTCQLYTAPKPDPIIWLTESIFMSRLFTLFSQVVGDNALLLDWSSMH